MEPVKRNSNFRLFACMNPPNDVGKRELPPGLRNRFTEFYVDELESVEDLEIFVNSYLEKVTNNPPVRDIVTFYLSVRKLATTSLSDGTNFFEKKIPTFF